MVSTEGVKLGHAVTSSSPTGIRISSLRRSFWGGNLHGATFFYETDSDGLLVSDQKAVTPTLDARCSNHALS